MVNYIFGDIQGVKEGDRFKDRLALRNAGIHLMPVNGIDGNRQVGCSSIVLNGGYIDDFDSGDEIIYTGHGGNDTSSKRQISDQSWDSLGNKALLISEMLGLPVRVTRGHKHKSKFSPPTGYVYGGLYRVTEHFENIGKDSFLICRYKLQKIKTSYSEQINLQQEFFEADKESKRLETTILRIIRDTKLSQDFKKLYNYTCQVCEIRISIKGIGYAEAAHIRPLGRPHNGQDKSNNLLCLCPNHHVMLDKGIIAIENNFDLIGIDGKLSVHKNHFIEKQNLEYNKNNIFINY